MISVSILRIYPGRDGTFDVYEDAGNGYTSEDDEYAVTTLERDETAAELAIDERDETFPEPDLVLVGNGEAIDDGGRVVQRQDTVSIEMDNCMSFKRVCYPWQCSPACSRVRAIGMSSVTKYYGKSGRRVEHGDRQYNASDTNPGRWRRVRVGRITDP
ncbi:DUF5110 domain-containing protein [Halosolutus gelatinilyticus]|uniref:DUF5110 domain-containing protein n=1 Tax=Halosolutus gelatinilyticus TaxID=2931975 RepID=UPI002AAFB958|nr:DUF5110 domain-containing protein [Halosolutus gelatinilyticus]